MNDAKLSPVAQGSMVTRLRTATRQAHKNMETVPALVRLLGPDLTDSEYVSVLRQAGAFYLALALRAETVLKPGAPARAFLDGARLQALTADLGFFGVRVLPPAPIAMLPLLATEAEVVGALYVLEGSDLGGRVIAKRLAESRGLTPDTGGRFYGGHDAESTRARWLRFCALLQRMSDGDGLAADAMVRGATMTFRSLEDWMRQIPSSRGILSAAAA
jgi:heme oxygenase